MNIREKILVIEDEKSIARFISTILTANGYEAMRAASGAEAMSMISSHRPAGHLHRRRPHHRLQQASGSRPG